MSRAKFDVFPEQIIDYLALVGDSSDNIPGVPKVGPKTAAKWLGEYSTVDGILENADAIKGKVGESLRDNVDKLRLSQLLATIRLDVDLPLEPEALKRGNADVDALRSLYSRAGVAHAAAAAWRTGGRHNAVAASTEAPEKGEYETVLEQKAFDQWLAKINKADLVAVDTETTSLNYMEAELVGISLAVEQGEAAYIPVAHDYPGAPDQLDRDAVLAALKPFLENPEKHKVGHHLKYDAHIFARYDIGCAACSTTRCLNRTSSTASQHAMTWTQRLVTTLVCRRFTTKTLPAKAQSSSRLTR